jgi:hypothetical protein
MRVDFHPRHRLFVNLCDAPSFVRSFVPLPRQDFRGDCIGNNDTIRKTHNSFTMPDPFVSEEKAAKDDDDDDVFHFVSFVPIGGKVYVCCVFVRNEWLWWKPCCCRLAVRWCWQRCWWRWWWCLLLFVVVAGSRLRLWREGWLALPLSSSSDVRTSLS